jgi:hypothetical protein
MDRECNLLQPGNDFQEKTGTGRVPVEVGFVFHRWGERPDQWE